jgi:hypothetical protein
VNSEIEERIILESLLLALREIASTEKDQTERLVILLQQIQEARSDADKQDKQIESIKEKLIELASKEDGKASAIKAFGQLPGKTQALILAAVALLAASGWLTQFLRG